MRAADLPTRSWVFLPDEVIDFPLDVDAFIAGVPEDARVMGLFTNQFSGYVAAQCPRNLAEYQRRYPRRPLFDEVPYRTHLRHYVGAARLAHPDVPLAEALRRLGRSTYPRVLSTLPGRAIFAALGRDLAAIFRHGPRAYELLEKNGTRVSCTSIGPRAIRCDYAPSYHFLQATMVGVVEGAALYCGASPVVTVRLEDAYHGTLECRW
jgi:uncharacterized protein (TIGR02265 family)